MNDQSPMPPDDDLWAGADQDDSPPGPAFVSAGYESHHAVGAGVGAGAPPPPRGSSGRDSRRAGKTAPVQPLNWLPERLPEDIDAERSFLSTCCAPGASVLAAECVFDIEEADFVHPAHRALFRALRKLLEEQTEISSLSLKDALDRDGNLSKVGGYVGLTEILSAEDVERPAVLANLIKRKSRLRKIVHLGAELVRQAATEGDTPEGIVEEGTSKLLGITMLEDNTRGLLHTSAVGEAALHPVLHGLPGGVLTGFERLDSLISGFPKGGLIVLAARPGIGKTALALNWLLASAMRYKTSGAFFSLEMSNEELYRRLISTHARLNMKDIQAMRGHIPIQHLQAIKASRAAIDEQPLYICDNAGVTVPEIRAHVQKRLAQGIPVDIVMIDYMQLISSPASSRGAKNNEAVRVGEISRGLKLMAKEFRIPVVVLSQLNREVEHRQGGKPQLSDLRDSGAIEQDSDIVLFIHRKLVPIVEGAAIERDAELIIAKHRNGAMATINMYFEGEFACYTERTLETTPVVY